MSEQAPDDIIRTLRECSAQYLADTDGRPIAVLLALEEYERYLDLLDDEADSEDGDVAARLKDAAGGGQGERQSFPDYLDRRGRPRAEVSG